MELVSLVCHRRHRCQVAVVYVAVAVVFVFQSTMCSTVFLFL